MTDSLRLSPEAPPAMSALQKQWTETAAQELGRTRCTMDDLWLDVAIQGEPDVDGDLIVRLKLCRTEPSRAPTEPGLTIRTPALDDFVPSPRATSSSAPRRAPLRPPPAPSRGAVAARPGRAPRRPHRGLGIDTTCGSRCSARPPGDSLPPPNSTTAPHAEDSAGPQMADTGVVAHIARSPGASTPARSGSGRSSAARSLLAATTTPPPPPDTAGPR